MTTLRRTIGWIAPCVVVALVAVAPPDPASAPPAVRASEPAVSWNLEAIGAPLAWPSGRGAGIVVAVLDSGVDLAHPRLEHRVVGVRDCVGSNGDPAACTTVRRPPEGHGTHVAGIVAGSPEGRDTGGVAPEADLLAVRVLDGTCGDRACAAKGSEADVAAGIAWAVGHGADIVNLSLTADGDEPPDPILADALRDAWASGVIVVAAAGSHPGDGYADLPVVVVTALDRGGRLAPYSRGVGGARWAMAAPGGRLGDSAATCASADDRLGIRSQWWSAQTGSTSTCLAGTSMAAPHVAGAAAVLLSSGLTPPAVVRRLLGTATDLGAMGTDREFGAGALDLARAVDPSP